MSDSEVPASYTVLGNLGEDWELHWHKVADGSSYDGHYALVADIKGCTPEHGFTVEITRDLETVSAIAEWLTTGVGVLSDEMEAAIEQLTGEGNDSE